MLNPNIKAYVRLRVEVALPQLQFFSSSEQKELREVMSELRIPTSDLDPDEGTWEPSDPWMPHERRRLLYHYRRGLTRQKRIKLSEVERHGADLNSDSPDTGLYSQFIIYRETTSSECIKDRCPRGITVEAIWPEAKLLSTLNMRELQ